MADKVFIVTRIIKSTLKASMEIRMGIFESQEAAEEFINETSKQLRSTVEFALTADGQDIGMTLGSALMGLGIGAITHDLSVAEVTGAGQLVERSSGLILPPGMHN